MSSVFKLGIDSGSTTVKIVLLDENEQPVYQRHCRHHADILGTLAMLLQEAGQGREDIAVRAAVTGSAAMAMAERLGLPFVQEVIAETKAINRRYPQTDVIIELGGEDAKVTYLGRSTEHRMNGSCAGGTGAFIDQMATLLQTDAAGLNELARNSDTSYPIAARCGVFAKTDVQALLNQGASKENIAHLKDNAHFKFYEQDLTDLDKVLEIGTGSGYQTAVLAQLVERVFSVERIKVLQDRAKERLVELNLRNVVFRWGDGWEGWPALAPYNGIIVTAVATDVPQALLDQLAPGGRLVIPVGAGEVQQLMLIVREEHGFARRVIGNVRFVPLLNGPLA